MTPDFSIKKILAVIIIFAGTWTSLWSLQTLFTQSEDTPLITLKSIPSSQNLAAVAQPAPPSEFRLIIGGDIMFDRSIRRLGEQNGYDFLFEPIKDFLLPADLVVANLEGPITSYPSKTLLSNKSFTQELIFTFATTTAQTLANYNLRLVSLANNHTSNFGLKGLIETKHWLQNSEINWFGDPNNATSTSWTGCPQDFCLAFVGYHQFSGGLERMIDEVRELDEQGYFVIVMPHWGEEYETPADPKLRTIAEKFVAVGANLIVGAHPHIVLNNELINNVPVYYSLGNFLFDQYFSQETMHGLLLELVLAKNSNGRVVIKEIKPHEITTISRQGVELLDKNTDL